MTTEIHVTDVLQFIQCPRKGFWGGRWGLNLRPVRPARPLDIGSAVHQGMDVLYSQGGTVRSAQIAVSEYFQKSWMDYESAGGWIDEEVQSEWAEDAALAYRMIPEYARWAATIDMDWEIIDTERSFELDLPGVDHDEFHLAGRIDGVVIHKPSGTLWLREYKTARSIPDEQKRIAKDIQARVYCWAASKLYNRPVVGIEYRFLRKAVPQEPRVLKSGVLSVALTGEGLYVTKETFEAAFHKLLPDVTVNLATIAAEGYGTYYHALCTRDNTFFVQYKLNKTETECEYAVRTIIDAARRMLNPVTRMDGWSDWYKCNYCSFRSPCDKLEMGYDVSAMLRNEYRERGGNNGHDEAPGEGPSDTFSATIDAD